MAKRHASILTIITATIIIFTVIATIIVITINTTFKQAKLRSLIFGVKVALDYTLRWAYDCY